ncbi:hypothetical protein LSTR_LSTR017243 [Laodelphax striatellus]|uniref:Uncharacterized protein n=1 Tax=Laodelphax striatellus TaxID=195883 RepID=A0A482XJE6_LAOST|nr:hypothetical protein LSTR_LSTR017243 [Laodelphax striatellus]
MHSNCMPGFVEVVVEASLPLFEAASTALQCSRQNDNASATTPRLQEQRQRQDTAVHYNRRRGSVHKKG